MSQISLTAQMLTAGVLAERLGGSLRGCPPERVLVEVKPLDEAGQSAVSFLANAKYHDKALQSGAGLILCDAKAELGDRPQLVMENPYWGFAQAIGWLHPEPVPQWSDTLIHPSAQIGEGCRIAPNVSIGAGTVIGKGTVLHPGVTIGEHCEIGEGCELFSGVALYRRTRLGKGVRIHANAVLGSDGYGYVLVKGRHEKVPQVGWVEVEDDVEIGAATTIDRGVLGPTRVGAGTKIDNLCQIAHNVQIGRHCLIVSQTGISGSTGVGDYVTLAGKVGVVGHIHIGSRSVVGGNSVVAKDVPEGSFITGFPARPHRQWMESQAALNRLPALMKRLGKRE
ncbi:MAG: UDP-3-O-(3-hydroxymyristoyl)glucosamine N-acyltransferase [Firmicutes bacterium]|nr:UDP-3-O-(3-hydroxymyristoyl)glucosamine N-acyltransferase [Bacillota bacterium]